MTRRRTCPGCGVTWSLRLNRGAPHQPWHDDPRCVDCRLEPARETQPEPEPVKATPRPVRPGPEPVHPAKRPAAELPPAAGFGHGTLPAPRTCPRCGTEWTLLVDRPERTEHRTSTCYPCRGATRHGTLPGWIGDDAYLKPFDPPGEWVELARCTEVDLDLFFPERGGDTKPAKSICQACEVRVQCLDYALRTEQAHGVWGGLSANERHQLKAAAS